MKILIVSQYFWPENFRINDIVSELACLGHEVTVLTGLPNYPEGKVYPEFVRNPNLFSEYKGMHVIRVPLLPRGQGSLRLVLNYLSFVVSGLVVGSWRLRGRNIDAIFVFQTSPITVALPAVWLRRCKRAPMFLWILDLWPGTLTAIGVVKSRSALAWIDRLVAFIYRRSDRILVQSKTFIPSIEAYAIGPERIKYFPNWAEPIFHAPLEETPLAREMLPYRDTFNVLFAGNIGEAQDFPAILEAATALRGRPDIRWLILGDGRAADWVRTEVRKRSLGASVILLGRHPIERMPSFFRGAQALLVSLRTEVHTIRPAS